MKHTSALDVTEQPAAPTGVACSELVLRPVVVTQDLVNEIIARAKASRWGLDYAKCETSLAHYADEDEHTLAMILVNGWEAKYDLVSLFSAAIAVVNEKAQNAPGERPGQEARELKP